MSILHIQTIQYINYQIEYILKWNSQNKDDKVGPTQLFGLVKFSNNLLEIYGVNSLQLLKLSLQFTVLKKILI